MKTRSRFLFFFLIAFCIICGGCSTARGFESPTTSPISTTPAKPASAKVLLQPEENLPSEGIITGSIQADKSFTGPVHLYSQEINSGEWEVVEVLLMNGKGTYQLDFPAGSYKLFFHSEPGIAGGYTETGQSLKTLSLEGGTTISDILVMEVFDTDCGPMFGIPASPDGRFAVIDGAAQECLAELADAMT